jgi:hypothetical protein
MDHVVAVCDDPDERDLVHYDAPALLGAHTLCGHVDRTDYAGWEYTSKRVNCRPCLAVRDHVLGRKG